MNHDQNNDYNDHWYDQCPYHQNTNIYDVSYDTIIKGYTKLPLVLTNSKKYKDISNMDGEWIKIFFLIPYYKLIKLLDPINYLIMIYFL